MQLQWRDKMVASILLRGGGIAILALSYLAAASLRACAVAGPIEGDALAYFLAAAVFLCGTMGSGLTILGAHIFDRVEVSQRWSRSRRD